MRAYFGLQKKGEARDMAASVTPSGDEVNSPSSRTRVDSGGMFTSFFGRSASFAESPDGTGSKIGDITSQWLNSASSTLSNSIEEILGDSAALSGENMDGFKRLLIILENEDIEIHTEEMYSPATKLGKGNSGKNPLGEVSLDVDVFVTDDNHIDRGERDTGEGCIQILLENLSHPRFLEICNQNNLSVSLVHAMRLLKILEIKASKIVTAAAERGGEGGEGVEEAKKMMGSSKKSAERVCKLLEVLCADPHTTEILNNNKSLEKLLTYPMTSVPACALHLQTYSARVIAIMTRQQLSSEQVWLLHESNSIPLMVRNLKEMVTEPPPSSDTPPQGNASADSSSTKRGVFTSPDGGLFSPSGAIGMEAPSPSGWSPIKPTDTGPRSAVGTNTHANRDSRNASPAFGRLSVSNTDRGGEETAYIEDNNTGIQVERNARGARLLKGAMAEKTCMWVVGMEAIAGVLSASQYVNPVLISDFESAGGYKLLVHILSSSSQQHFMNGLITVTKLLCDPFRGPDSPIADLTAGAVILEVLVALLQIDEGLETAPIPPHAMRGVTSQGNSPDGGDDQRDGGVGVGSGDSGTGREIGSSASGLPPLGKSKSSSGSGKASSSRVSPNAHQSIPGGGADLVANDLNKLSRMAYTIYTHQQRGDLPLGWQGAVQSISYTLLTLYSNQPRNCLSLEGAYHYLTILLLALPALALGDVNNTNGGTLGSSGDAFSSEAITAVLTTLDYVCNCASDATVLPLAALTAATSVTAKLLLFTPAGGGGGLQSVHVPPTPGSALSAPRSANGGGGNTDGPALLSPLYPMGYSPHTSNPAITVVGSNPSAGGVHPSMGSVFDPGPGVTIHHLEGLLRVLPQVLDTYDNICRLKSVYNQVLLKSGLLTHLHCAVFENLYLALGTSSEETPLSVIEGCDGAVPLHQVQTYTHIIELLLILHTSAGNDDVATEARQTGLTVLMRNLMRHSKVGIELTKQLLLVPECLACPVNKYPAGALEDTAVIGSTTHLEEGVQSLLDIIRQVRGSHPQKVTIVLRSIRTMLLQSGRGKGGGNLAAGAVWRLFGGYYDLLDTFSGYSDCFVRQEEGQTRLQVLKCLHVAFEIIVCDMALHRRACATTLVQVPIAAAMHESYDDAGASDKALRLAGLADALRKCGVFAASASTEEGSVKGGEFGQRAVILLVAVLTGFPKEVNTIMQELGDEFDPGLRLVGPIINPEAAMVILELLPDLLTCPVQGLAKYSIELLVSCAEATKYGYMVLSDMGCTRFVLYRYGEGLISAASTQEGEEVEEAGLHHMLLSLVTASLESHLSVADFAAFLRVMVRGHVLAMKDKHPVGESGVPLLPPAAAARNLDLVEHGPPWAVQYLLKLSKRHSTSPAFQYSMPYLCLGYSCRTQSPDSPYPPHGHMSVQVPYRHCMRMVGSGGSDAAFSHSMWIKWDPVYLNGRNSGDKTSTKAVHLFSFAASLGEKHTLTQSNGEDKTTFFEVVWILPSVTPTADGWGTAGRFLVYVRSKSSNMGLSKGTSLRKYVYVPADVKPCSGKGWHHVVVVVNKKQLAIYVDGLECRIVQKERTASHVGISFPTPAELGTEGAEAGMHLVMGQSSIANQEHQPLLTSVPFQSGPILVFDRPLTKAQAAYIYTTGPTFSSKQPGHSSSVRDAPLQDHITSISAELIHRLGCADVDGDENATEIDEEKDRDSHRVVTGNDRNVCEVMSGMGLSGLEAVVEPCLERSVYAANSMALPRIPCAILEYNPIRTRFVGLEDDEAHAFSAGEGRSRGSASPSPIKSYHAAAELTSTWVPLAYLAGRLRVAIVPNTVNDDDPSPCLTVHPPPLSCASPTATLHDGAVISENYASCPQSFMSCVEALGGPGILLPLLQSASTESDLLSVLTLLKRSLRCSSANFKTMQAQGGYKALAFILYRKPRSLLTSAVMRHVFSLSYAGDAACAGGQLLSDTVAMHHITLNQAIWRADNFSHSYHVLEHLHELTSERTNRYAKVNTAKLGALGCVKWVLHLLGHGAAIMERQQEVGVSSSRSSICWPSLLLEDQAVADGSYSEHALWSVSLSLLHDLLCLELRKRDLELIAMMIMHSFSAGRPLFAGFPDTGSNDVEKGEGDSETTEYLTASSILRFSLLKLLFGVVERCYRDPGCVLSDIYSSAESTFSPPAPAHDIKDKSISPIISGAASAHEREGFRGPLIGNICVVFGPDWFLCVLERVSDRATFTTTLRFLVLCLQADVTFRSKFYSTRGWPALRSILMCRPQGLSVVLPLLALLLNVPVATVPQASLLTSSPVANFSMLLSSTGPMIGKDSAGGGKPSAVDKKLVREVTLPSLSILLEAISVHASAVAANAAVYALNESVDGRETSSDKPVSAVSELILSLLVSFTAKVGDCRSSTERALHDSYAGSMIRTVLQSKDAIAAITRTLLDCSTAVESVDSGAVVTTFIDDDAVTGNTIDMTALLGEDHFSEALLTPSHDDTCSGVDSGRVRGSVRYIEDDDDSASSMNATGNARGLNAGANTNTDAASPVGYEGRQLHTLLSHVTALAIEARTHSNLNSYRLGKGSQTGGLDNSKSMSSSTFSSVLRKATSTATQGATLIEAESEDQISTNVGDEAAIMEPCGNIVVLSALLTSFPSHHPQGHHVPYQLMISDLICEAVIGITLQPAQSTDAHNKLTVRPKMVTWSHVAQALTLLVPLSEAKTLEEPVLHNVNDLCVQLLSALRGWLAESAAKIGPHQLSMWLVIYKDLAITCRSLVLDLLRGVGSTDSKNSGSSAKRNMSVASGTIRQVKDALPFLLSEPIQAKRFSFSAPAQVFYDSVDSLGGRIGDQAEHVGKWPTTDRLKERMTASKPAGSASSSGSSTGSSRSQTTLGRFFGRSNSSGNGGSGQGLSRNRDAAPPPPLVPQLACSGANDNPAFGLHQSATCAKYAASDTFIANVLVICQSRLLDDDDNARSESAMMMSIIFSSRRKYCRELLCVPLVLPYPLHHEDSFLLPPGVTGSSTGTEIRRTGSLDVPSSECPSPDHGNLHAIISMNAYAHRARRDQGETAQHVPALADPYEGYDIPTLRSIYGVNMDYGDREGEGSATEDEEGFYTEGMLLLAPHEDGEKVASSLRDGTISEKSEESASRLAAYSFWMTDLDHQVRVRRLFDHIERALLLYLDHHPDVTGASGVWNMVADMRTPDALTANGFASSILTGEDGQGSAKSGNTVTIGTISSGMTTYESTPADDFTGVMTRAEEGQRRGEAVIALSKRWRCGGLSVLARGGVIWHSLWTAQQCGLLFGYRDPFGFDHVDISAVVTLSPQPVDGGIHDDQTTHRSIVTRIGPTSGTKPLYLPHPRTGRHAKIYRLILSLEGPERVRRVQEQEYEAPLKLRVDMPRLRRSITGTNTDEATSAEVSSASQIATASTSAIVDLSENEVEVSDSDDKSVHHADVGSDEEGEDDDDPLDSNLSAMRAPVENMEEFLKEASRAGYIRPVSDQEAAVMSRTVEADDEEVDEEDGPNTLDTTRSDQYQHVENGAERATASVKESENPGGFEAKDSPSSGSPVLPPTTSEDDPRVEVDGSQSVEREGDSFSDGAGRSGRGDGEGQEEVTHLDSSTIAVTGIDSSHDDDDESPGVTDTDGKGDSSAAEGGGMAVSSFSPIAVSNMGESMTSQESGGADNTKVARETDQYALDNMAREELQHQRALDKARKKTEEEREAAVLEIVRALVGPVDWPSASIYNVRLISGLELCQAILVVTKGRSATGQSSVDGCRLHIIPGFQAFSTITGSTCSGSRQAGFNRHHTNSGGVGSGGNSGLNPGHSGRVSPLSGLTAEMQSALDVPFTGVECGVRWVGPDYAPDQGLANGRDTPVQWASHSLNSPQQKRRSSSTCSGTALNRRNSRRMSLSSASHGASGGYKRHSQSNFDRLDEEEGEKGEEEGDDEEEEWLDTIWYSLLAHGGSGHAVMESRTIYSLFKRRHELKYTALEISDTRGQSFLLSLGTVGMAHQLLGLLLNMDLPSSIFKRLLGTQKMQLLRGVSHMYNKLMTQYIASASRLWEHGQLTNFEYLMHLNSAAGRSVHDLTQYPVFPWVLQDYTSESLDLGNPLVFRDLSKPMGALGGGKRLAQFQERYASLDELMREEECYDSDSDGNSISGRSSISGSAGGVATPPFFYGTHYSCAGYVLHYLARMQPFTDLAISLQGGRFDQADRLFLDINASWVSASKDNLQDVRELIPEFFYCPEFLTNHSGLDLGETQRGDIVHDVGLPPWAENDPNLFIKKHREALESPYVSQHLHEWIDLIFGYKQRGQAAIDAENVFIHLTYEGEVDVDAIEDPVLRAATISQINNFGQCPSQLFGRPHKARRVPGGSIWNVSLKAPSNKREERERLTRSSSTGTSGSSESGCNTLEALDSGASRGGDNLMGDFDLELEEDEPSKSDKQRQPNDTSPKASGLSRVTEPDGDTMAALKSLAADHAALAWLEQTTPPFSVVGAPRALLLHAGASIGGNYTGVALNALAAVGSATMVAGAGAASTSLSASAPAVYLVKVGKTEQFVSFTGTSSEVEVAHTTKNTSAHRLSGSSAISDVSMHRGTIVASIGLTSLLLPQAEYGKKIVRFGSPNGGICVLTQRSALSNASTGLVSGMSGVSNITGSMNMRGNLMSGAFSRVMGGNKEGVDGNTNQDGYFHHHHNAEYDEQTRYKSDNLHMSTSYVSPDMDRDIYSVHERLHAGGPVVCACIESTDSAYLGWSASGTSFLTPTVAAIGGFSPGGSASTSRILVTGGHDGVVKLWDLSSLSYNRKIRLVSTLVGHTCAVQCLDFCPTHGGLVVSGGLDGSCCLWDAVSGKMLREMRLARTVNKDSSSAPSNDMATLSGTKGAGIVNAEAVLSVSVNPSTGDIVVLTRNTLEVYSVNGTLLGMQRLGAPHCAKNSASPTIVRAVPRGAWQDGVVCVTGHAAGTVHLWEFSVRAPAGSSATPGVHDLSVYRGLNIVFSVLPDRYNHSDAITCLRITCSSHPHYSQGKNPGQTMSEAGLTLLGQSHHLVERWHMPSGCFELLVGDMTGRVTRWTAPRLEMMLNQNDK